MLKARIKKIIGKLPEQNQCFDFTIKWSGGGERILPLTIYALERAIAEHGPGSPHDNRPKFESIELNHQQIWP
jgi:hypothetical protein